MDEKEKDDKYDTQGVDQERGLKKLIDSDEESSEEENENKEEENEEGDSDEGGGGEGSGTKEKKVKKEKKESKEAKGEYLRHIYIHTHLCMTCTYFNLNSVKKEFCVFFS